MLPENGCIRREVAMSRKAVLILLAALLAVAVLVSCDEKPDVKYHTVAFDPNGGEGSVEVQNVPENTPTALNTNAFTRTDYSFSGWNTNADGSGTAYGDKAEITLTENIILYAQWTHNKATVSFVANGGTGTMEPQVVDTNTKTTLNANTFTYDGNNFYGWNTEADGSGEHHSDKSAFSTAEDMVLYAQWVHQPVVTFHGNGGSGTMEPQKMDFGTSGQLNANEFSWEGHGFRYWTTNADGTGDQFDDGDYAVISNDLDLYAQWVDLHMKSDTTVLLGGYTYFVNTAETVEIAERIVIDGTDAVTLKVDKAGILFADKGISVLTGQTLIIDGGEDYLSNIYANFYEDETTTRITETAAGIGGLEKNDSCGTIVFKGLVCVLAKGGAGGAGIGGAEGGNGGNIVFQMGFHDYGNFGSLTAEGGQNAPGIGGGEGGNPSQITFDSGLVSASGGDGSDKGIWVMEEGAGFNLELSSGTEVRLSKTAMGEWDVKYDNPDTYDGRMEKYMCLDSIGYYSHLESQPGD